MFFHCLNDHLTNWLIGSSVWPCPDKVSPPPHIFAAFSAPFVLRILLVSYGDDSDTFRRISPPFHNQESSGLKLTSLHLVCLPTLFFRLNVAIQALFLASESLDALHDESTCVSNVLLMEEQFFDGEWSIFLDLTESRSYQEVLVPLQPECFANLIAGLWADGEYIRHAYRDVFIGL